MNLKRQAYLILLTLTMIAGCNTSGPLSEEEMILDRKVDSVLKLMNLEEKLGQLTLYTSYWDVTGPVMRDDYLEEIKTGRCGNIFNAHTVEYNRGLQKLAVEETRLGIPLLFGYDVIHGHKTIFPVPLAEACTWDPELLQETARLAAKEATASGLNWTFAPMVDISRDSRWGRVSEGNGEDPYLASRITEARVRGYQGDDLSDMHTMAACIKHFAGYGAPFGGRDYNTVDMSEIALRQDYLPPYQAGINAGAVSVMASFNELFGVPAHINSFLLTDILRDEWGFGGFVVGDYAGVHQVVYHGAAKDDRDAAEKALKAGLDMDMTTGVFVENLEESYEEGAIDMETVERAVRRVLKVKFRLGLFDDPYRYLDETREKEVLLSDEMLDHALKSAQHSIVLLKNEKDILPLKNPERIALIGPMADNKLDMLGSWHAAGDQNAVVTVLEGLQDKYPEARIAYAKGCDFVSDDRSGFREALAAARRADVCILALGESQSRSGEAASRSTIDLGGVQEELAMELIKTGTPVIVLIMGERALTFQELNDQASTVLYAWHLGTRGGDAVASILSGDHVPSGKLVLSIPRNVGQIPVYYNHKNTGRPYVADDKYTTKYLDVSNEPLYHFGYGLSYTEFSYSNPVLSDTLMENGDSISVQLEVSNTGQYDAYEIVQLYVRDMVGSITRPVKELKGFQKIFLRKGESRQLNFTLTEEDLAFVNQDMTWKAEPGMFTVYTGPNSEELQEAVFRLK